jgi:two-component system nitrate/nitrite response regulator NarL
MTVFKSVLLDPDKLLREGLRRLLEGSDFTSVGEASTFDEARQVLRDQGGDLLLFDFCAHSEEDFEFLRQVRAEHQGLKTVVLTNRISGALLAKALDAGADGYLLKDDLSSETLVQSLRLVMLGEKVLPTRLAGMIRDIPMAEKGTPVTANGASLSQRETDVLRRLVHGHSNKTIARELGITDATVKVHLKSSLRKIGAINRTQAAIWALKHGLGPTDAGECGEGPVRSAA